jgi:hypothetical protein
MMMSKSVMGGSVMKLGEPCPRRPGHTGIRCILARRSPWSASSRRIATKFNQTVGHIVGLVDFYRHPTAAQGSNPSVRSQSSGWPLSARSSRSWPNRERQELPLNRVAGGQPDDLAAMAAIVIKFRCAAPRRHAKSRLGAGNPGNVCQNKAGHPRPLYADP